MASISQGRICSDNCTYRHTEIENQTCYLTQSQYTDTGPTSPSADPISPGAWQGSHRSTDLKVTGMSRPGNIPHRGKAGIDPRVGRSLGARLYHQANEAVELTERIAFFCVAVHTAEPAVHLQVPRAGGLPRGQNPQEPVPGLSTEEVSGGWHEQRW